MSKNYLLAGVNRIGRETRYRSLTLLKLLIYTNKRIQKTSNTEDLDYTKVRCTILRLIFDLIVISTTLLRSGGKSAFVAEYLLEKQQLVVINRKKHRAKNLAVTDRLIFAITSLLIKSSRLPKLSEA